MTYISYKEPTKPSKMKPRRGYALYNRRGQVELVYMHRELAERVKHDNEPDLLLAHVLITEVPR